MLFLHFHGLDLPLGGFEVDLRPFRASQLSGLTRTQRIPLQSRLDFSDSGIRVNGPEKHVYLCFWSRKGWGKWKRKAGLKAPPGVRLDVSEKFALDTAADNLARILPPSVHSFYGSP
jgi:hypothetical protein